MSDGTVTIDHAAFVAMERQARVYEEREKILGSCLARIEVLNDRNRALVEALRVCQVAVFMAQGSENESYRLADAALAALEAQP